MGRLRLMQRSEFRLLKLLLCQSVQWCEKVFDSFGFEVSCLATRWVRTSMDALKRVPHIEQWKWANICQWFLADFLRLKLFVAKYKEVECLCSFFVLKLFSVWLEFVFFSPCLPSWITYFIVSILPLSDLSPLMWCLWNECTDGRGSNFTAYLSLHMTNKGLSIYLWCVSWICCLFLKLLFEKMNL